MKRARCSFESFAALAKAGAAPGKREAGGHGFRAVPVTGTTGRRTSSRATISDATAAHP